MKAAPGRPDASSRCGSRQMTSRGALRTCRLTEPFSPGMAVQGRGSARRRGRASAVSGSCSRCRAGRMCGIGSVGEALHIRPRPAGGGSAESCGNVPAFNTVEILPCAEGSALHMGDRLLKTDVLGRVAESCGKHGIRLRGRPFRMCSTPATGPRRPCTVREGPRREVGPARTPRAGGHVRGARGGPVDRGPDPAGGAVVGRDMQDVVPESRRVPAAAAAGRDARDIVGGDSPGDDAGERGERSGHADRDDDTQGNVMLVT